MSIEELKSWNPNKYLDHKILEPIPFIFNNNFDGYLFWKSQLSQKIDVDSRAVSIVGSAAIGFSLNPSKNFKAFDASSDIDIAIVSHYYFDISWHRIRNLGSLYHSQPPIIKASLTEHVQKLIYWGTIATDKILPILPFCKEWSEGKKILSNIWPTENREINFRIYKDFESLRAYQLQGVRSAQEKILEEYNV